MSYSFINMNKEYANEIAYNWKYDGEYSFYDMTSDEDDLKEFIDPDSWINSYFAVMDTEGELIGFFSYIFEDEIMWIGLGLKPSLTGVGIGNEFVASGIEFGLKKFAYSKTYIMLAVALFNQRAIKLYENMGFKFVEKYVQRTNNSDYEFIKMKKNI